MRRFNSMGMSSISVLVISTFIAAALGQSLALFSQAVNRSRMSAATLREDINRSDQLALLVSQLPPEGSYPPLFTVKAGEHSLLMLGRTRGARVIPGWSHARRFPEGCRRWRSNPPGAVAIRTCVELPDKLDSIRVFIDGNIEAETLRMNGEAILVVAGKIELKSELIIEGAESSPELVALDSIAVASIRSAPGASLLLSSTLSSVAIRKLDGIGFCDASSSDRSGLRTEAPQGLRLGSEIRAEKVYGCDFVRKSPVWRPFRVAGRRVGNDP